MLRLAVLISGSGSNLRALLEACEERGFPARVVVVGADRDAAGFQHAEDFGVPTFDVPYPAFPSREAWGEELLAQLRPWEPDLVILSGLMRLLPPLVVDALAPRLINTHPAFLPEFPGAHAVRDALAAGAALSGASVIVVDHGIDDGPILCQERVPVLPDDSERSLHERIKTVERRLLVGAIRGIATGEIDLGLLAASPAAFTARTTSTEETV